MLSNMQRSCSPLNSIEQNEREELKRIYKENKGLKSSEKNSSFKIKEKE